MMNSQAPPELLDTSSVSRWRSAVRVMGMESTEASARDTCRTSSGGSVASVAIGVTARAHLVALARLGIRPAHPVVKFQPTSQRLSHSQSLPFGGSREQDRAIVLSVRTIALGVVQLDVAGLSRLAEIVGDLPGEPGRCWP
jgi:hypothetical protein